LKTGGINNSYSKNICIVRPQHACIHLYAQTENYWYLQEMPGFGQAAELVAWRVPKGATTDGGSQRAQPLCGAKGPKTIDAQTGSIEWDRREP
jgi:hypothetical protein